MQVIPYVYDDLLLNGSNTLVSPTFCLPFIAEFSAEL